MSRSSEVLTKTDKIKSNKFNSRYNIILVISCLNIAAFTILRLLLLISCWNNFDHKVTNFLYIFGTGFLYDLTFSLYFSIPLAFLLLLIPDKIYFSKPFRLISYIFFFLILYIIYFDLVAEWLFWDEFNVRFNFISVDYLIYRREVTQNIYESYHTVWLLLAILIASVISFSLLKKKLNHLFHVRETFSRRLFATSTIIALSLLAYFFVDQSLRELPKNNYVRELASDGPYQFVAAFRNNKLDYKTFYAQGDDIKLSRILKSSVGKNPSEGGLYDISRTVKSPNSKKKLNVILISVESLSARYLTRFGNKEHITPFMDHWFKEGILFTDFYATGTRTTRGLEAITLSVPPTPGRSLVKRPDNKRIFNLGKVFRSQGYDVVFLYGGRGFFDNMNAFFSGNGYRTIDQTDFREDEITFENAWGVADEDLYRKAIQEANKIYEKGQPFFFHIMTTSNHRPYTYPEGKIDIPSGTGRSGAVKYTDYAMKVLISLAKKQKWFEDTLFVITADHCAGSAGKVGLPIGKYHIPLFIYSPKHISPREIKKISSQIDIAPTILSLLGFSYKSWFFGRDILDDNFIERALIGNYQRLALYKDNMLVILSPQKKIEVISDPYHNDIINRVAASAPLVPETMAYYQGANYILENRLNRW